MRASGWVVADDVEDSMRENKIQDSREMCYKNFKSVYCAHHHMSNRL